jgi:hypothetical protein
MPMMILNLALRFPFSLPLLDFGVWNGNDLCGEPFETLKRRLWLRLLGRCWHGARYASVHALANRHFESSSSLTRIIHHWLTAEARKKTPATTIVAAPVGLYSPPKIGYSCVAIATRPTQIKKAPLMPYNQSKNRCHLLSRFTVIYFALPFSLLRRAESLLLCDSRHTLWRWFIFDIIIAYAREEAIQGDQDMGRSSELIAARHNRRFFFQ